MENSWVKLYRKLLENDIIRDVNALTVFIWLLLKVDRTTGEKKVARSWGARELNMKPGTFYDALMRLVKKYKMATAIPTAEYTKITLSNWAKYQQEEAMPNRVANRKPTATQQQANTLQEGRSKNKEELLITDKLEFGENDLEGWKRDYPTVDVDLNLLRARDWLLSTGKRYKDYRAFFRNWLRGSKPTQKEIIQL